MALSRPSSAKKMRGLKSYAIAVAAKLELLGRSTYIAVADALVAETFRDFEEARVTFDHADEEKNIRRRVYDALNVLVSMGFVARDKKNLEWLGVRGFRSSMGLSSEEPVKPAQPAQPAQSSPGQDGTPWARNPPPVLASVRSSCTAADMLRGEIAVKRARIAEKRARLSELKSQQLALQSIVSRNLSRDGARVTTGSDVCVGDDLGFVCPDPQRVDVPFVMVSASKQTSVSLEMEDDREELVFNFDGPFRIHEGYAIVRQVCRQASSQYAGSATTLSQHTKSEPTELVTEAQPPQTWPKLYDGHANDAPSPPFCVTPVLRRQRLPPATSMSPVTFNTDHVQGDLEMLHLSGMQA